MSQFQPILVLIHIDGIGAEIDAVEMVVIELNLMAVRSVLTIGMRTVSIDCIHLHTLLIGQMIILIELE